MNLKHTAAALLCAAMLLTSAACANVDIPAPAQPSSSAVSSNDTSSSVPLALAGVDAQNYPRVDGSTASLPLMAQVYSEVCGVSPLEAETLVEASGTGQVWRSLLEGNSADLLMVYEASETLQAEIRDSGPKLEIDPLGRDGLVFLANAKNPLDSLTQEQLRDIYTGRITDWGELGGTAGPISAFQRNEGSGSQTLFLSLLMKELPPMTPPTELVPGFMSSLIDGVATYDGSGGAIGFSVFYYANEMYANPNIKLLAVDGVEPSASAIGDGSYPLVNDFYVVIRADEPQDSPARLLRDWLLTNAGRLALEAAGYVPAAG
ncbi:MAG: PstS family phosphate ABC transporter substrate-binding protein [Acetanaerobacterium sp.]